MDAGSMRRHDPRLLLLAIYSTVIGMVTEVEVLRARRGADGPVPGGSARRRARPAALGPADRPGGCGARALNRPARPPEHDLGQSAGGGGLLRGGALGV